MDCLALLNTICTAAASVLTCYTRVGPRETTQGTTHRLHTRKRLTGKCTMPHMNIHTYIHTCTHTHTYTHTHKHTLTHTHMYTHTVTHTHTHRAVKQLC